MMRRNFVVVMLVAAGLAGVAAQSPVFQVDPFWPKPLPNSWILGSVTGVAVDSRDRIWVVHRGQDSLNARTEASLASTPPGAEACCRAAPFVLEFDAAGTLVSHWGGPGEGYEWPVSPGGLTVDDRGNVWIAAAGPPDVVVAGRGGGEAPGARGGGGARGAGAAAGAAAGAGAGAAAAGGQGRRGGGPAAPPRPVDAHVLKFTRTGQFVLQIGKAGDTGDAASTTRLNEPADVAVDTAANEVYVADGGEPPRIAVFNATTGAYKRHWGGHATPFARLSCVALSRDGLVYVCDRKNNRLQVFRKDGTFVTEGRVSPATLGNGSVWDVAFSPDAAQQFVYVADGQDMKVFVLNRKTLATVSSFGSGGRWPGGFYGVGSIAVDAKGTIYTGETYEGKRVQRFMRK